MVEFFNYAQLVIGPAGSGKVLFIIYNLKPRAHIAK
jgi:hypothetical protein